MEVKITLQNNLIVFTNIEKLKKILN